MTRFFSSILLASIFIPAASLSAQDPAVLSTSATVKPALDSLQQTLLTLRPEKWKVPNTIAQQTQSNINSIATDIQTTLPPLLAVADQHPGSVAELLPAFRNVSALYDVLLRITQIATLSAPSQQTAALQQSMISLESSRRDLGDSLQASAQAQAEQIHTLQTQARATPAAAVAPVSCPQPVAVPVVKKRKPKPKPAPAATPATAPAATPPAAH